MHSLHKWEGLPGNKAATERVCMGDKVTATGFDVHVVTLFSVYLAFGNFVSLTKQIMYHGLIRK